MRPENNSASAEAQIRDLPPHPIYEIYERFGLPYCLQLQGWGFLSEIWRQQVHKKTLVNLHQPTWRHVSKDNNRQTSASLMQFGQLLCLMKFKQLGE